MATNATRPRTAVSSLPPATTGASGTSKRKRASAGDNDGVDRLSALPDALLHSVMSFLPAPQAVRTCLLSRRWRDLWCSAPCLDIDSNMPFVPNSGADPPPAPALGKRLWERLEGFTTKLLHLHTAPTLDVFRLRISIAHHEIYLGVRVTKVRNHVVRWILRGASYQPAALEVRLRFVAAHVRLPPLGSTSTACRRLRRLSLSGVLLDGGFAEHLRTGCPILEELELNFCDLDFQEIVSGTLRSLTVDDCFSRRRPPQEEKWCVRVTAPCLDTVSYRRCLGRTWSGLCQVKLAGLEAGLPRVVTAGHRVMLMIL
ncbi:unnamed protein product [Urochloa humidicola]